ncbi:hypothetical protein V1478_018766 [Vespula squamosa]|uniref:Uncharacterized protein n=1 Tax=Vespula squamosa TaxID=30214 RepID=A0ABD1ZW34_VESSQ
MGFAVESEALMSRHGPRMFSTVSSLSGPRSARLVLTRDACTGITRFPDKRQNNVTNRADYCETAGTLNYQPVTSISCSTRRTEKKSKVKRRKWSALVSEPPPPAPEPSLRISLDAAEHQAAPHCVPTNSTLNETLSGISYRVLSLFQNK